MDDLCCCSGFTPVPRTSLADLSALDHTIEIDFEVCSLLDTLRLLEQRSDAIAVEL